MKTVKAILNFLLNLLAVAKWIPFLGKYRALVVVASTILTTIAGLVTQCESTSPPTPVPTKTQSPTPISTPIHTPSPSPTPTPQEIILDRVPHVGNPFTVRYTAAFQYNTHLWADKYRLQALGRDADDGNMIAYAVVLNTAGSRKLTVRDSSGVVLASKIIEVQDGQR